MFGVAKVKQQTQERLRLREEKAGGELRER